MLTELSLAYTQYIHVPVMELSLAKELARIGLVDQVGVNLATAIGTCRTRYHRFWLEIFYHL